MVKKNLKDYERDIRTQLLALNDRRSQLINLRKDYANNFQVTSGKEKEHYKSLLTTLDNERHENKKERDYLRSVTEKLNTLNVFNRDILLQVMAYIVSIIEDQEYEVVKSEIPFFDDKKRVVTGPFFYNFLYLTPSDSKKKAEEELKIKYPYALSAKNFKLPDLFQGENYVGISLFKQTDTKDIIFSAEPINIIDEESQASFGYIGNDKFSYLNDFIEMLIDYKAYMECEFGRGFDCELTYEELYNLANQFIAERKVK